MHLIESSASLRTQLLVATAAILLLLSVGLTGIGYWSGNAIVEIMSAQLIKHMTTAIRSHVGIMMDAPSRMLARTRNTVRRHAIPLTDPHALGAELHGLLRDEPDIDWLYFANDAGGLVSTGRRQNATQVILMTESFQAGLVREYDVGPDGRTAGARGTIKYFDARRKDWFISAKETRQAHWSDVYLGIEPVLGVSISIPVTGQDGKFAGAFGLDLILTHLSEFMRQQRLGSTGRAFLVDADGLLIAATGGVSPVALDAQGRQQRLHPADARDPVIRATARHLRAHPEIVARSHTRHPQSFVFDDATLGPVSAAVDQFPISNSRSWLIVSALPEADFFGAIRTGGYLSLGLAALLLLLALAIGYWLLGRALQPLRALTGAAHAISNGAWPDLPQARRTDEIGVLARALADMTRGLRKAQDELERRVLERTEELATSLSMLNATLDSTADGILAIHTVTGAITCNNQFRDMWDIPAEMLAHGGEAGLIAHVAAQTNDAGRFLALAHDHDTPACESFEVITLRDGRTFERYSRPRWIGGKAVGIVASYRDVTERLRAERELSDTQHKLQAAARVAGMAEIATNVLHNVGNVLNSVNVSAALLATRLRGSKVAALARTVALMEQHGGDLGEFLMCDTKGRLLLPYLHELAKVLEAERAGMLEDLQVLGKSVEHIKEVVASQQSYVGAARMVEAVDLGELVDDALRMNLAALSRHQVEVTRDLAELPVLLLDRQRLLQVLINLISNAKQAMEGLADHRARITLSASRVNGGQVLRITVADNGKGIAPENLTRVFSHGFTTRRDGHGFGLHSCVLAAQEMGGSLTAHSAGAGRGATFVLELPLVVAGAEP